jgi:hypothetical protein
VIVGGGVAGLTLANALEVGKDVQIMNTPLTFC